MIDEQASKDWKAATPGRFENPESVTLLATPNHQLSHKFKARVEGSGFSPVKAIHSGYRPSEFFAWFWVHHFSTGFCGFGDEFRPGEAIRTSREPWAGGLLGCWAFGLLGPLGAREKLRPRSLLVSQSRLARSSCWTYLLGLDHFSGKLGHFLARDVSWRTTLSL